MSDNMQKYGFIAGMSSTKPSVFDKLVSMYYSLPEEQRNAIMRGLAGTLIGGGIGAIGGAATTKGEKILSPALLGMLVGGIGGVYGPKVLSKARGKIRDVIKETAKLPTPIERMYGIPEREDLYNVVKQSADKTDKKQSRMISSLKALSPSLAWGTAGALGGATIAGALAYKLNKLKEQKEPVDEKSEETEKKLQVPPRVLKPALLGALFGGTALAGLPLASQLFSGQVKGENEKELYKRITDKLISKTVPYMPEIIGAGLGLPLLLRNVVPYIGASKALPKVYKSKNFISKILAAARLDEISKQLAASKKQMTSSKHMKPILTQMAKTKATRKVLSGLASVPIGLGLGNVIGRYLRGE